MHVGIIMDGNRKYAKKLNLSPSYKGHVEGKKTLKNILMFWAKQDEPKNLTLYTFSSKNLEKRNKIERTFIFHLLKKGFKELSKNEQIFENEIKVIFIGNKEKCPKSMQKIMNDLEEKTKKHNKKTLAFCVCYDGQEEIVNAFEEIKKKDINKISKKEIKKNLHTSELPPVDLVIRTGGEKRLSGFLLWDVSYSELIFNEKKWPEYTISDFKKDISEFKNRNRRFGK